MYGYGYISETSPFYVEPKTAADCPQGRPVFYPAQTFDDGYGGQSRRPARCGQPRSQEDCPSGTTFEKGFVIGTGGRGLGMPIAIPSKCAPDVIENVTIPDDPASYGATISPCPKGYEFKPYPCAVAPCRIGNCVRIKETLTPKEVLIEKPKEVIDKVTTALKPQTEEAEYRTWIVATIIGVGLYLILSSNKSAQ
jgi:hypothetical protein